MVGNNFLSTGPNSYFNSSVHAEWDAIKKAKTQGINLKNTTLLVYRFIRDHDKTIQVLANSKPCCICQSKIYSTGIQKVYSLDYIDHKNIFNKYSANNLQVIKQKPSQDYYSYYQDKKFLKNKILQSNYM